MNQEEFKRRRRFMMEEMGEGNIAIVAGATEKNRNRDVDYPFRQDSDFYYLTGFAEPNSVAVFIPGRLQGEYLLFCSEFDAQKALWEGAHAGLEGAVKDYGADDAFPIEDLDDILPGLLENKARVFYPMGRDSELNHHILEWVNTLREKSRSGIQVPGEFVSLEHVLHEMRLFKSAQELTWMRQAAEISTKAHKRAMRSCQSCQYEFQIEAELIHEFMFHGLRSPAYPSIVASGANACVLHYTENSSRLQAGDLLLIDAGAECNYYPADITRTFPVSGRFSQPQKLLYQLVLDAQLAAIEQVKPGIPWNYSHDIAIEVLTKGLVDLGILSGAIAELIEEEAYKPYYMHRIGHWLGLDVHDVGDYKLDGQWRVLESGMVLTIEPGLYIPQEDTSVAPQWRGIGIRIEDDVLVTENGCEVLTDAAPKSIQEIEALMQVG